MTNLTCSFMFVIMYFVTDIIGAVVCYVFFFSMPYLELDNKPDSE